MRIEVNFSDRLHSTEMQSVVLFHLVERRARHLTLGGLSCQTVIFPLHFFLSFVACGVQCPRIDLGPGCGVDR